MAINYAILKPNFVLGVNVYLFVKMIKIVLRGKFVMQNTRYHFCLPYMHTIKGGSSIYTAMAPCLQTVTL